MLNFIRRIYANRQRAIFRFWDGTRKRGVDPILVVRALESHPEFNWEVDPQLIEMEDADREAADGAFARIADATRMAFGIPLFDGKHGLTEGELLNLLGFFVGYLNALKKNTSTPLTSPEPTASASLGESDTTSPSVSGSMSGDRKTAAPVASSLP